MPWDSLESPRAQLTGTTNILMPSSIQTLASLHQLSLHSYSSSFQPRSVVLSRTPSRFQPFNTQPQLSSLQRLTTHPPEHHLFPSIHLSSLSQRYFLAGSSPCLFASPSFSVRAVPVVAHQASLTATRRQLRISSSGRVHSRFTTYFYLVQVRHSLRPTQLISLQSSSSDSSYLHLLPLLHSTPRLTMAGRNYDFLVCCPSDRISVFSLVRCLTHTLLDKTPLNR